MAFRRSLTTSARLFTQHRFAPSFSYAHREDDRKKPYSDEKAKSFLQNRSYSCFGNNTNTWLGFGGGGGGVSFRDPRWSQFLLARNMSTGIGDGEKIEHIADTTNVLTDQITEVASTQAPAISEVAVAAADSSLPVAALQYAIDGIHNFTGLNWWASIVITTLVIRTLLVPIVIHQMKATSKRLALAPVVEPIYQEKKDSGTSLEALAERHERIQRVYKENGVSTFTSIMGTLIQGPVFLSFFFAIQNMVQKVPSFENGGVSWFIDLTTADSFYIFPFLSAFLFWMTIEFNTQEGVGGKPGKMMKNGFRGLAALSFPLTASMPKAIFCYWITSNLFSLVYGLTIKKPSVMKLLNIPMLPPPPPPSPAASPGETKPAITNQTEEHKSTNQIKGGKKNKNKNKNKKR